MTSKVEDPVCGMELEKEKVQKAIIIERRFKMNMIANVPQEFFGGISTFWGFTVISFFLFAILAIVLLIDRKLNRTSPQSIEGFLNVLKEKYREGEIPKKEYEDIKNEIKEPLLQIKNYMKLYK